MIQRIYPRQIKSIPRREVDLGPLLQLGRAQISRRIRVAHMPRAPRLARQVFALQDRSTVLVVGRLHLELVITFRLVQHVRQLPPGRHRPAGHSRRRRRLLLPLLFGTAARGRGVGRRAPVATFAKVVEE